MLKGRLQKELGMLTNDPAPGVTVWQKITGDQSIELEAQLIGPEDTPYSQGVFSLSVSLPPRYPFEPPRVRFITPVYHPNIDNDGRICLDTLKMQPQGSWSPASNIRSVLLSIRLLLAHPNADDGLVPDITDLYKRNLSEFNKIAEQHTIKYAKQTVELGNSVESNRKRKIADDENVQVSKSTKNEESIVDNKI